MECINVLVCEHNCIFYDDRHRLLALLATGSGVPLLYLAGLTTEGTEDGGWWWWNDDSGVAEQFDK